MLSDLARNPEIWDEFNERRTAPNSPHQGMTDVWVRARARDELTNPLALREAHYPVFYPVWAKLPSMHHVVWTLMAMAKGTHLGNVLITRIPPGGQILPHVDTGWAPEHFDQKFYIVLAGNEAVTNYCGEGDEEEAVVMLPGSIWAFENRVSHRVINNGETDRISLIVTLRSDGTCP